MRRFVFYALFIVFFNSLAFSRPERAIKGRVSDNKGNPLAAVRVEVVEFGISTQTLPDGTFSLENLVLKKVQLLFTHPDYLSQSIEVDVSKKPEKLIEVTLAAKNPILLTIKEEITVTAEADSIIDVNLPSHRTILPSSVLTEMGTTNVAEAVEKIPGVAAVGKGGYSMVPAIRGLAEHRILLLIDGIRVTSERRIGESASFTSLNNIDHIEVNRGPYSVFHGSGAIGGVINIITKSPAVNAPLKGNFNLGYNTARKERAASVNLSGSWGKWGFMVSANGKKADDYSSPQGKIEQSHYSDYDFLLKANRQWENSQFYVTVLHYKGTDIGKPSPASRLKPQWYPEERNTLLTLGYSIKNKLFLENLSVSFSILQSYLESQKENLRETLTLKKKNSAKVEGTNFGLKVRGGRNIGKIHTLNFGFDFFGRGNINDKNTEWEFDENGNITKRIEEISLWNAKSSNLGFYIDDKIKLSSSLTINLGARYDFVRSSNQNDLAARILRNDQSFTAYLGSEFHISPSLSIVADMGRSFRFPTISELFYTGLTGRGTVFGNDDLVPEKSVNLDIGLRYLHDKFFASIYGFSTLVKDMIQKYSGADKEEFFYRNLTQGRISGVEGEFYFSLTKDVELFVNFHHIKGREKQSRIALNYIPPSRLTFWAKFSKKIFWIEPKVTFVAAQKDTGPLEIDTEGYTYIETIIGCKVHKNLTLLTIAQNVLNQTYRLSADEQGVDASGRGMVFKAVYSF